MESEDIATRKAYAIRIAALTALMVLSWPLAAAESHASLLPARVEIICIDPNATGYATFQSHNQKVVSNQFGIFESHIRTRNEAYTAQTWRLSRSTDGGKTFTTVYEATNATNAPPIETDKAGNIYLAVCDWLKGDAYLYRFPAATGFLKPSVTTIPGAAGGKFALAIDEKRGQLYFFSHNNTFSTIGMDGRILSSQNLLKAGTHAVLQYPQLCLDETGVLHAAWTTSTPEGYLYWDIHHMVSPDGGKTWRNLDGAPLALPVAADDSGPTLRITRYDEFHVHTWLSNFLVHCGKVHFVYEAQFPGSAAREHYIRYDIAKAVRDVDEWPQFGGKTISLVGLDGFFASRSGDPKAPLFCVANSNGHIACLRSTDNGSTWQDYALSDQTFSAYSIGGCREITRDGYVIGTFTDQTSPTSDLTPRCKVYLIKIKAM